MKELIDFLQREFSDDVKEIQTDLQCICDCLDRVHSEVDKRLPTIKGDYSKIGEYYAMGQELKQIKEKIKAICDLFPESEECRCYRYTKRIRNNAGEVTRRDRRYFRIYG